MKAERLSLITCVAVLGLGMCPQAKAADHEFQDIVKAISEQFNTKPMHIPSLGLARAVIAVAHPMGAKQLNLAIFQDLDERKGSGRDLLESVRMAVGRGWQPFVQIRGNRDQNMLVYMVGKGNDVRMLITTVQGDQATVVEVKVNPESMQRWITSPNDAAKGWFGHEDRGSRRDRNLEN
jgi:hypothetical protein